MVDNFFSDLQDARTAEEQVLKTFSSLSTDYSFVDVSSDRSCFHRGDIIAIDKKCRQTFIEVKKDGRIAQTRNVLCEEMVDFHGSGRKQGNMYSDYEIYCVVSEAESAIYVIDFKVLRAHYKEGRKAIIPHAQQTTYAYLLPLKRIKELGGLIAIVDYSTNKIYQ